MLPRRRGQPVAGPYVNEWRILTLLHVEEKLTRADIATRLSLPRPSITHLVDGLIARRLLREADERPPGGSRRWISAGRFRP